MRLVLHIAELDCPDEVGLLRQHLENRPGIERLEFDLLQGTMAVEVSEDGPQLEQLNDWVRELGMTPVDAQAGGVAESEGEATDESSGWLAWLERWGGTAGLVVGVAGHVVAGAGLAEVIGHSDSVGLPWVSRVAYLVTIVLGLRRVAGRAWSALQMRRADMHVLMVIAVGGAMVIDQWLEAAVVVWLFVFALRLESRSVQRARGAIGELLQIAPTQARCWDASRGEFVERPISDVVVGDELQVLPGDRVPVDGQVLEGVSDVDASLLTGESMLVTKHPGDELLAGVINQSGSLRMRAAKAPGDSTLSQIVRLMQQAQQRQANVQRWVDRFAERYTPTMVGVALLVFGFGITVLSHTWYTSMYNALVILVIACPCALVISTPVSLVAALTSAARHGVLIKGGDALELLCEPNVVIFDKTGTLTRGQPVVGRVEVFGSMDEAELLRRAAGLESGSRHPFANALRDRAKEAGIGVGVESQLLGQVATIPGAGLEATGSDGVDWIGNCSMLERHSAEMPQVDIEPSAGETRLWLGRDQQVMGLFTLQDQPRDDARETIERLGCLGVERVRMLSGDERSAAGRVAERLGLDDWQAQLLPADKATEVEQHRAEGRSVIMVGDGINDSVALAAADVGVAMGRDGTDVAAEAADVVLMGNHLVKIAETIEHARRTRRVIQQNVGLAVATKVVFLVLATAGWATLWMAIAADMGVSLVVIANALRLLQMKGSAGSRRSV